MGWVLMTGCLTAWTGCAAPEANVQTQQVTEQTRVERKVETPVAPAVPALGSLRIAVRACEARPGAELVERAVGKALREAGIHVLGPADALDADLTVVVASAVRRGPSWGGMPSHEVLLRYHLLDATRKLRHKGVGWGSCADAVAERAIRRALDKTADIAARKLRAAIAQLPPLPRRKPDAKSPTPRAPSLSLACLPIRNATGRSQLDGWCEALASIAAQEFKRLGRHRIVERARLQEILHERDVREILAGAPGAAQRVGRKLGVDLLLVGEVAFRPNGDLLLSARLVRSTDASIQHVVIAARPPSQSTALERDFCRQLAKPTAGWVHEQMDQLDREPVRWPDAAPGL